MDRASFVALLPEKVYVDSMAAKGDADSAKRLQLELQMLGATKTIFVKVPASSEVKALSKVPPRYPTRLRQEQTQGGASFLVLVGEDGAPRAIFCAVASHPLLGVSGAAAIAHWKFTPPRIRDKPATVILEVRILYSIPNQ
jgi:hypothetical protein